MAKENSLQYSLSLVNMSMDYKEYSASSGALLDSETSNISDISGYEMNLEYIFDDYSRSYDSVSLNLMKVDGNSKYKGSYLYGGGSYGSVVSTTKNTVIDTSIEYKHTDFNRNNLYFSYGVGVGYRAWDRKLSSTQDELYEWYSIRPMLGCGMEIDDFNIGIFAEYQFGINPTMSSTISSENINFKLGGADVFELTIPVKYSINENVNFFYKSSLFKARNKQIR